MNGDFFPASCINQGQRIHFCERMMELMRLWHESYRLTVNAEEFRSWFLNVWSPKELRIIARRDDAANDAFTRSFVIGGIPPFLIDLDQIGQGVIANPSNQITGRPIEDNSGSLLAHHWALRGEYADANGGRMNDTVEWALRLASIQAAHDTWWDRFIDLDKV